MVPQRLRIPSVLVLRGYACRPRRWRSRVRRWYCATARMVAGPKTVGTRHPDARWRSAGDWLPRRATAFRVSTVRLSRTATRTGTVQEFVRAARPGSPWNSRRTVRSPRPWRASQKLVFRNAPAQEESARDGRCEGWVRQLRHRLRGAVRAPDALVVADVHDAQTPRPVRGLPIRAPWPASQLVIRSVAAANFGIFDVPASSPRRAPSRCSLMPSSVQLDRPPVLRLWIPLHNECHETS